MSNGVIYYTDGQLDPIIRDAAWAQLAKGVAVERLSFIAVYPPQGRTPGILTMLHQIVTGLEHSTATVVFLCEHDVLYHPSHFEFTPARADTFYYNTHVWHVRYPDGHAVYWDHCQQVSGLCAHRELLLDFYTQRIAQVERDGFNRHYEPGLKQTVGGRKVENWRSAYPNLDIRHGANLTASKWRVADFRNPQNARGWREADDVDGWGHTADLFGVGV
jgi:hypothetical protein